MAEISPRGFVRREHVGKSYADEDAAKLAIAESFRVWSSNAALSVTVAVLDIDEPRDPSLAAAPDEESAPQPEPESAERIGAAHEAVE